MVSSSRYLASKNFIPPKLDPMHQGGRPTAKKRHFEALIIEDNPVDQKLMERHLKRALGQQITTTSVSTLKAGLEALNLFYFDVLFLDLGLPECRGPETVSRVAELHPEVPIIVITGQDDYEVGQQAIHRGAQDFLAKKHLSADGIVTAMRYAIDRQAMRCQIEQLVSLNSAPIMVVDFNGIIQFANKAASQLFNAPANEIIGESFDLSLCNNAQQEAELTFLGCKGIPVEVNVNTIQWHGQKSNLVTLRDLTRHKFMEEKLTTEKELALAINAAKDKFLANLSHELRTPLNAILGFSDLILAEVMGEINPKAYEEYIRDIHKCGANLLKQVEDMLDLAEAGSNKLNLNIETLDLTKLLHDVVEQMKHQANASCITLSLKSSNDSISLEGDAKRLAQVIRNLLSNAIKFSASGSRVVCEIQRHYQHCRIRIIDEGCGIDNEDIAEILEPFAQVDDNPYSRATEGSGLGLPIAKHLIELHDGQLELRSLPGIGTEATILLPLRMKKHRDH